jgi:hypothetical protein
VAASGRFDVCRTHDADRRKGNRRRAVPYAWKRRDKASANVGTRQDDDHAIGGSRILLIDEHVALNCCGGDHRARRAAGLAILVYLPGETRRRLVIALIFECVRHMYLRESKSIGEGATGDTSLPAVRYERGDDARGLDQVRAGAGDPFCNPSAGPDAGHEVIALPGKPSDQHAVLGFHRLRLIVTLHGPYLHLVPQSNERCREVMDVFELRVVVERVTRICSPKTAAGGDHDKAAGVTHSDLLTVNGRLKDKGDKLRASDARPPRNALRIRNCAGCIGARQPPSFTTDPSERVSGVAFSRIIVRWVNANYRGAPLSCGKPNH